MTTQAHEKSNLKNKKRGGFYWKNEKPYASVTQLLNVIDKPSLRYWFGEQVYFAMVADPTLEKSAAMSAPYKVGEKAKSRGTTVHSIVEAYKKGTSLNVDNIPDEFRPYAQAFYKWAEMMDISIVEMEKTVFCEKYQYGGTLDLLVRINGKKELIVVDVKTGKDIYQEAFMQTAAYQYALKESGQPSDSIGVLLLTKEGDYKFQMSGDSSVKFKGFLACRDIWMAINEDMLRKIGYIGKEAK
jgi:hypothetical protein